MLLFLRGQITCIFCQYLIESSTGPTPIPPWALVDGAISIARPITDMINNSIKLQKYPAALKKAQVTPVFKKGDLTDPTNYRPISITPSLSKVFERLMQSQINEYLNKHKLLYTHQYGFRKGRSTKDGLLYINEKI